ncbi:hypothetical protein GCM10008935_18360 [Alkalibacillus silvisoli]|uniref:Ribbon-helix-helix protein, CopG family n=2 Tax=Bacillaceae TaxID=186817 RepID=A0A345C0M7_9BACI|nr:hypothetical protein [Salicibibacter kimchii]AXF56758.1 hypothetical protein DT065_12565 [Salicibibacter kimchii]AXF56852.1 hypothetical protein DT065_13125 [Salicibibacter kimchii]
MDIVIRNVEPRAIQKVEELAKEQGISREQFLRERIMKMAQFYMEDQRVQRLEALVASNLQVMERCADSMQTMNALIGDEPEPSS